MHQVAADCVRMRDTLSTARINIYDYIITPLEIFRIRFLPVSMDAYLAIKVSKSLLIMRNVNVSRLFTKYTARTVLVGLLYTGIAGGLHALDRRDVTLVKFPNKKSCKAPASSHHFVS